MAFAARCARIELLVTTDGHDRPPASPPYLIRAEGEEGLVGGQMK